MPARRAGLAAAGWPAQPRFELAPADALAFISSNAATLGEAAIACDDLSGLLAAAIVIAALSHVAVDGSAEPYAEAGAAGQAARRPGARGEPGCARCSPAQRQHGSRIQDPYGYRALPQVHGPAVDAADHATR